MTNSEMLIKQVMKEHKKNDSDDYEETIEALIKMSNEGTIKVSVDKIRSLVAIQKQEKVFKAFIIALLCIILAMGLGVYGALITYGRPVLFCLSIVLISIAVVNFFKVIAP